MDEFANLADALPQSQRKELWRAARMIAAEGRKAGVHLALALQDPSHKSLDLRIRRNCLPLSFRVKDGDASRVILGAGGAEQLQPRQFMTVMNQLIRGVAFAPSDEEIGRFLASRPVQPYPAPDWLPGHAQSHLEPGVVRFFAPEPGRNQLEPPGTGFEPVLSRPEPALSVEPVPEPSLPFSPHRPPTVAERAYIRRLHAAGLSNNAVCKRVYGFKNGKVYGWVAQAISIH
jgi:DNA segregation ATPase FtsK/SpoIIIE-like protein